MVQGLKQAHHQSSPVRHKWAPGIFCVGPYLEGTFANPDALSGGCKSACAEVSRELGSSSPF